MNKIKKCKGDKPLRPVLFEIYGLKIYGYGLMIAIGIIVAIYLTEKLGKENDYSADDVFSLTLYVLIGGVLGGKILYLIIQYKDFIKDPLEFILNFGEGFVIYGSIIGGIISVYLFCKKKQFNILTTLDLLIPGVAIAQGFGRVGCFFAGCCYGKLTDSILGCVFNSPFTPDNSRRYPTQLFLSGFDFMLGLFLLWYRAKHKKEENKNGRVLALYLILKSIGRFLIEFLRDDPRGSVGYLSSAQFIGIFGFCIGLVLFIYKNKKREV